MWVKFEVFPSAKNLIGLPHAFAEGHPEEMSVRFGSGELLKAGVLPVVESGSGGNGSYENPERISISSKLRDSLLLPAHLKYRIKISEDSILIGPVIGLLLGVHTHRYNPEHMRKYSDRLDIYDQIGGLIYAFSPKSVNWSKKVAYGLYYNIQSSEWEYGCFPLPDVIYRRDFHSSPLYIKRLIELTGGRLFNSTRFTKMELYDYLSPDEEANAYLPRTERSENYDQVKQFIDRFPKVILKPVDLSRGRGICVIETIDSVYKVTDYRYKHAVTSILQGDESLENFFALNQGLFRKYLIQQYLNLARIGHSLFDIRVVMQKHPDLSWGCTGIECRVSNNNSHLTNISRGGYALTLDEALKQSFGEAGREYQFLPEKIIGFCQKFCRRMDQIGEHFAEFGIDIAVDTDQNIWLIEANVFPSFKGFKQTDRHTYLAIRHAPLIYALSLTPFDDDAKQGT